MIKTVYLTIDDAPSIDFLPKLEYLIAKQIPAVFFCIGSLLEEREAMAIECIRQGYLIANHSYSHPHFSNISVDQCLEEIEKTDQIIDHIYQKAGIVRPAKWFRFPYGDKGDMKGGRVFNWLKKGDQQRKLIIQNKLSELGYTQPLFENVTYQFMQRAGLYQDIDWSWTFDVMEWATFEDQPTHGLSTLEKIINRMQTNNPKDCRGFLGFEKRWLASDSAEVVLLHDHEATTTQFNPIIDTLLALPIQFADFNFSLEN